METLRSPGHLRQAAAALAALLAGLYLLTGSGLVAVTRDQPAGAVPPLLVASALFVVLAVLLLRVDRRWVWIAGAVVQVGLVLMYLVVASDRTPAFEPWGLTIKALQLGMLGTLAGIAVRRTRPAQAAGRALP